ncbi:MAG TPA: hypothetical protein VJ011_04670 [Steroidobacteraceae bacterium]|nr:hypothetical protein [Steroidobacteraceae bacterium]
MTAVRLDLDTAGLVYRKWGAKQRAKRGDWLVDNDGDVYTVDRAVFARTYRRLRPGTYLKTTPVWAERATGSGRIRTKEGWSSYRKGDYLVYNQRGGGDAYCVTRAKFESMYRQDRRRAR